MELEMLEDWLNNPEPAGELAEVELSEKVTEQQVSQGEDCRAELCSRVDKLRPQKKMRMAWEITVIYPIAENFCS
jgi:hypothetical protein